MAASPFTRAVVSSMRALYPECLADTSFDNTGLLLEAPFLPSKRNHNSALLTIDLTRAVADEAIENNHSVVIAYHPIIFRGLKAITLDDSQQQSLLKLAANGISVYCPHTAVDAVPGGMADWLCDIVTGKAGASEKAANGATKPRSPSSETDVTTSASSGTDEKESPASIVGQDQLSDPFAPETPKQDNPPPPPPTPRRPSSHHRTYSKPIYPRIDTSFDYPNQEFLDHTRAVIIPSPQSALDTAATTQKEDSGPHYTRSNTGAGRLITFAHPQPLTTLITRIAHAIGQPKGFPIAIPQRSTIDSLHVKTLALCPGSGGSVFKSLLSSPDLLFTGELTHHDALFFTERGTSVITLFHSNSERGYLDAVMRPSLAAHLGKTWEQLRQEMKRSDSAGLLGVDGVEEILEDDGCEVVVSERDRDPYGMVVLQEAEVEGVEL